MIIAGLIKSSLIDYPGKVAAVVFTQGCNFRCGFCHNADLIPIFANTKSLTGSLPVQGETLRKKSLPETEVLDFLKTRVGKLDGVVITGGEPTIQPDLVEFIKKIKKLGLLVKLDTNGSAPSVLSNLITEQLIDYIAMDVKNSPEKYQETCGFPFSDQIKESIRIIMDSGIDYEFRTTVLPAFHDKKSIKELAQLIKGARKYTLQGFRNGNVYDPDLKNAKSFTRAELLGFKKIAEKYVDEVQIRENI